MNNYAKVRKLNNLNNLIREAITWNQIDINGFDDISPTLEMLEARNEVLQEIKQLVYEITSCVQIIRLPQRYNIHPS